MLGEVVGRGAAEACLGIPAPVGIGECLRQRMLEAVALTDQ